MESSPSLLEQEIELTYLSSFSICQTILKIQKYIM